MARKHAVLSASGASRWLTCTPSAVFEQKFPSTTSSYAEEGMLAHALAELVTNKVLNNVEPNVYEEQLAEIKASKYYSPEMHEHAEAYAALILARIDEATESCEDTVVELESKLDFSAWVPGGFGTGDCVIISDGVIEIIDLKYGKGNEVSAVKNPQIRLYALGAIAKYAGLYDTDLVRMCIYQPRLSDEPSVEELSVRELLVWAEEVVAPQAKLAAAGKGLFIPGEATCKYCRAREVCRARAEHNLKLFDEAPDLLQISADEAGEFLEKVSSFNGWLLDLENYVFTTLMSGEPVKGWKLVEGRSNRKITDEAKVAEALLASGASESQVFIKKLNGITALEKEFGKKKFGALAGEYVIKPPGAPTLASERDKRPAFQPTEQLLNQFDEGEE